MKNVGIAGGLVAIGFGLTTIGLSNFQSTPQAIAAAPVAAVVEHGPEEPTIVWYDTYVASANSCYDLYIVFRAWSDGTVERKKISVENNVGGCGASCNNGSGVGEGSSCHLTYGWVVISSPTEGMNAAADINFDEIVDGADLAMLLGKWGDAPRNPMPPSECPLGLLNPS